MPKSNPKDAKPQRRIMRQGTQACRMGDQGNRYGNGPEGRKERRQGWCGYLGRKKTRCVNGVAKGCEIDEIPIGSKETQEGGRPERIESRVQSRVERRQKWHHGRVS